MRATRVSLELRLELPELLLRYCLGVGVEIGVPEAHDAESHAKSENVRWKLWAGFASISVEAETADCTPEGAGRR
jgi:hypothetical protein